MINFNYSTTSPSLKQGIKNLVSNVVDQFIVRPLGAPNLVGVSGFIFSIIDDEEVSLDSDITDHYVESNFAVQDHIALRPLRFTLRGFAGELVDDAPNSLANIFTQVTGLSTLGGLAPEFNIQDVQFYSKVNETIQLFTNVVNQAKNIFQLFRESSTTTNNQQRVYQYFYSMWRTRQLCSVETPFAIFDNMAIESIRALQGGLTRFVSEFSITFKQIQTTASVIIDSNSDALMASNLGSVSKNPLVAGGRFQQMVSSSINLGTDPGTPTNSNGSPITVANISQGLFLQQAQRPNQY